MAAVQGIWYSANRLLQVVDYTVFSVGWDVGFVLFKSFFCCNPLVSLASLSRRSNQNDTICTNVLARSARTRVQVVFV